MNSHQNLIYGMYTEETSKIGAMKAYYYRTHHKEEKPDGLNEFARKAILSGLKAKWDCLVDFKFFGSIWDFEDELDWHEATNAVLAFKEGDTTLYATLQTTDAEMIKEDEGGIVDSMLERFRNAKNPGDLGVDFLCWQAVGSLLWAEQDGADELVLDKTERKNIREAGWDQRLNHDKGDAVERMQRVGRGK